eukprot:4148655-Pleurochrysis_carterae.AAC.1
MALRFGAKSARARNATNNVGARRQRQQQARHHDVACRTQRQERRVGVCARACEWVRVHACVGARMLV